MELFEVQGTGRYEVRFNGSVIQGCFHDTDCDGARICAVNETWSAVSSQCSCDGLLGFVGNGCNEWGFGIRYILGMNILALVILVAASVGCVYCALQLLRLKEEVKSTLCIVTVIATLATFEFIATIVVIIYNASSFPWNFVVRSGIDDRYPSRIGKDQHYSTTHVVMLDFAFILCTVTMFFLAGFWASTAVNAQKISRAQGKIVEKVCFFYLLFAISVLIPTSIISSLWSVNGYIIVVVAFLLMIAFAAATRATWRLSFTMPPESCSKGSQSEKTHTVRLILQRIFLTSAVLSILCAVALITIGVYGIGPIRRPSYILPGFVHASREISYRVATVVCAAMDATVVVYLVLTIKSKIRLNDTLAKTKVTLSRSPPMLSPVI